MIEPLEDRGLVWSSAGLPMSDSLRVVVIGGVGLEPIRRVLEGLPVPCGFAVLVAIADQPQLAAALRTAVKTPVVDAEHDLKIRPDHIYVIPPNKDVLLRQGKLVVGPSSGPALDRLMRSVADELGRNATAVILDGQGTDGSLGIKRIKEAGGVVLVGPVTDGPLSEMPRTALATGLVDQVDTLEALSTQLCRINTDPPEDEATPRRDADTMTDTLRDILALVRVRSGHDFSQYKRATLYRRVARRMQVCQAATIGDYHQFLRDHPNELTHLLRDFLISVTNFFRDPEAHEALAMQVLPRLFAERSSADQIRVWVAGCATGEEAYSLGIMLLEEADRHPDPPQIQLFATDIDEDALTEARLGRYPEAIAVDVSPQRLERFFIREAAGYRVTQQLREMVLFSPHNLLRDPPFSRLDLVSCRNLLIYLNREAQERVLSMFHFGLKPEGYLFVGASESADSTVMFSALEPKYRLFSRRRVSGARGVDTLVTAGRWHPPPAPVPTLPARSTSVGELHHRLVEQYAPPSILVNGELEIVHLSEHAGQYLEMAGGEPTRHILRLIHPALRLQLRTAIYAARQPEQARTVHRVSFEEEGKRRAVELRVRGVDSAELGPNAALIYIDEADPTGEVFAETPGREVLIEPVVREIEEELHRTRDQLRTTIEQYETSVEELKASNDELQAINEELRSASDELETSKEELQSVNEELTTLNHELKVKVDEVSHANADLSNLMSSTDIGVLFLDRALNIKRFTPRALDLFNLIPSDIGRPLAHLTHRLDADDLPELALRVLQHLRTLERDVTSRDGRRYLVRLLPYRSLEDRIDGIVMTFVDVTDLRDAIEARRRSEALLQTSEARLRASLRDAPLVVLTLDPQLQVTWGNVLGEELSPGTNRVRELIAPHHLDRFLATVRDVFATGAGKRLEVELLIQGAPRIYDLRIEPSGLEATAVGFDVTSSKQAEATLRDADRRKDEFLATLSHELRNPLTPLRVALDVARATEDPAQREKSQAIMDRQVTQITNLVDELLDLSRITQGKIELLPAPLEVSSLVEAALEQTRPLISEARHELSVDVPASKLVVLGDKSRLTQVMANLISNAAKYTRAGGRIAIEVAGEPKRKVVALRVKDNGIGISPENLPHIFEIFVQSRDAVGRSLGGLGIGLSVVKRLVELHGGQVSAQSAGIDKGSEFIVELPLISS
jgi:two-component system CheB/CheR fusion protein